MEPEREKNQLRQAADKCEKRKHPRFSVDLRVEYYKLGSITKHDANAMNASLGGLLLNFSEPLRIGQHLRLKIILSSGLFKRSIEAITKVAWGAIHLEGGGGDYRAGVIFLNASPKDKRKLQKFLLGVSQ